MLTSKLYRGAALLMLSSIACTFMIGTALSFTAPAQTYEGPNGANYNANAVGVENTSLNITDYSDEASDNTSNDVVFNRNVGSSLYIGFREAFDGVSIDVGTAGENGTYVVKYWDGATWENLDATAPTGDQLENNSSSAPFFLEWERPSDWDAKTISEIEDEDNYYIKILVTQNYDNPTLIDQIGVLTYNTVFHVEDELNNERSGLDVSFFSVTGIPDTTIHNFQSMGNGDYGLALHGFLASQADVAIRVPGFVEAVKNVDVSTTQSTTNVELDFTHKITAQNRGGNAVNLSSVIAGSSDAPCEVENNVAYCPVALTADDSGAEALLEANGYRDATLTLVNRSQNSDPQEDYTVTMIASSGGSGSGSGTNNGTDLTVSDLYFSSNEDLNVRVKNIGDQDANENALLYVYVDGEREYTRTISETYLEEDDDTVFAIDSSELGNLDDNEDYEIRACIDPNNDVNESDNSNNCRTEDLNMSDPQGNDGVDLEIDEIYVNSSEDLFFVVKNTGDETADARDGDLEAKIYVDDDIVDTLTIDQDGSTYLEGGDEDTVFAGNLVEDLLNDNEDFEVRVCIDTDNEITESNNSNNCLTVDSDDLDNRSSNSNNDSCGNFRDLSDHWAEEYVCDLFDRDVVEGRNSYYFYPNSTITRAEFLKMTLLGLDMDPYYTSGIYFSDVRSSDWYAEYITYAAAHGIVEGYEDGSFHPNSPIARGEAVVLLMRAVEEATGDNIDVNFSAGSIDYSDVDVTDYFAYAVVWADQYNLVEGYSSNRFGPRYNLSRAEAAKIIDLAYQEWID